MKQRGWCHPEKWHGVQDLSKRMCCKYAVPTKMLGESGWKVFETCQPEGNWKSQPWERPSGQSTWASLLENSGQTTYWQTFHCDGWTWCSQRSGYALQWPSILPTWSECQLCSGGGSCSGLSRDATLLENSPHFHWLHTFLDGHWLRLWEERLPSNSG